MARIKIFSDSGCDLPTEVVAALHIGLVPLSIRFGEEEFADRVTLTPHDFWEKCRVSATLPETAAPSPGAFEAAYEAARAEGYDGALVFTISAKLSATFQSATLAAEALRDRFDVRIVDTAAVSAAQGLLIIEAAEAAERGATLDELEARAQSQRDHVGVIAMLSTLDHLVKGGRVGGARALLGQVLAIRPLLALRDGLVTEAGRQRTTAKALRALADGARAGAPLSRLAVINGDSPEVDALVALVADIALDHPLFVTDVGPTVGTHAGPGVIGLAWLRA